MFLVMVFSLDLFLHGHNIHFIIIFKGYVEIYHIKMRS